VPSFRDRFRRYAAEHFPRGAPPAPVLAIDAEAPLPMLTLGLMNDFARLEPYGAQNPKPRFLTGDLRIVGEPKKMGVGERHLSFQVSQGPTRLRAVAFGMADRLENLMSAQGQCCLVHTPVVNEWQGRRSVELHVADFQPGPDAVFDVGH
jgi:single-stranded-DNA-specific exonuclease